MVIYCFILQIIAPCFMSHPLTSVFTQPPRLRTGAMLGRAAAKSRTASMNGRAIGELWQESHHINFKYPWKFQLMPAGGHFSLQKKRLNWYTTVILGRHGKRKIKMKAESALIFHVFSSGPYRTGGLAASLTNAHFQILRGLYRLWLVLVGVDCEMVTGLPSINHRESRTLVNDRIHQAVGSFAQKNTLHSEETVKYLKYLKYPSAINWATSTTFSPLAVEPAVGACKLRAHTHR